MNYCVSLRIQIQQGQWIAAGGEYFIPWAVRNLIAASSGWTMLNQENYGSASSFVPLLEKGVFELIQNRDSYRDYEIMHGFGTIDDTLKFYQSLMKDCKEHPFAELYGYIVS